MGAIGGAGVTRQGSLCLLPQKTPPETSPTTKGMPAAGTGAQARGTHVGSVLRLVPNLPPWGKATRLADAPPSDLSPGTGCLLGAPGSGVSAPPCPRGSLMRATLTGRT